MASDRISRFVDEILSSDPVNKKNKTNQSVYVDIDNWKVLEAFCILHKAKGLSNSNVVDRLIDDFLDELRQRGELPATPTPHKKTSK